MKKYLYFILGIIAAIGLTALAAAPITFPINGGTGTSTIPTIGQVLVGQSNGTYGPQSTTTLGLLSTTSAASTYVPYTGATGGVNLNSQSLVNVSSLAIGASSGSDALDIVGSLPLAKVTDNSGTGGRASVGVYNSSGNGGFFRAYGTSFSVASLANTTSFGADGTNGIVVFGNSTSASGASGSISLRGGGYDTAAENLLLDKNGSYFTHGNVGIGTSSPIRGLTVSGSNLNAASEIVLNNTGMPANNKNLDIWGNSAAGVSGQWYIRTLNDAGNAGTQNFMSFDNSTGNIGIDQNPSSDALDVNGSIGAAGQISSGNVIIGDVGFYVGNSNQEIRVSSGGVLAMVPSIQLGSGGEYLFTNGNWLGGTPDAGITRLGANSLAIGNSGAGDFTGNLSLGTLGIASSSPSYPLTVVGNSYLSGTLAVQGTATSTILGPTLIANTGSSTADFPTYGGATPVKLEVGPDFSFSNFLVSNPILGLGNTILNENGRNVLVIAAHGANANDATVGINTFQSRGTTAAPTATQLGDDLYFMGARGFGTTTYGNGSKVAIRENAAQNWTDSAQGTYITLETTPNNSTTRAEVMRIGNDGRVGIGTTTATSTLDVNGNVTLEGNSFVVTPSISGALVSVGCDTATTNIDNTVSSTTAAFVTTPQTFPGVNLYWQSYLSSAGVITTEVCSTVASVTPIASKYNIKIIK